MLIIIVENAICEKWQFQCWNGYFYDSFTYHATCLTNVRLRVVPRDIGWKEEKIKKYKSIQSIRNVMLCYDFEMSDFYPRLLHLSWVVFNRLFEEISKNVLLIRENFLKNLVFFTRNHNNGILWRVKKENSQKWQINSLQHFLFVRGSDFFKDFKLTNINWNSYHEFFTKFSA